MTAPTPNPGSPEAVALNCSCAVLDNGHGRGHLGDGERFGWWITASCPLHGEKPEPPVVGQGEEEGE